MRNARRGAYLIAGISAALITGGAYSGLRARRPAAALNTLAEEYSARRPFEARVKGAKFGRVQSVRGGVRAAIDESPRFLETLARIGRGLEAAPDDAEWLHARGLADLLLGKTRAAMGALRAASDLGDDTPAFWTDFGLAYFEWAEQNGSADEYTIAVELLGKAAAKQPAEPSIRFNQGLAYLRLELFDEAIDSFRRSMELERDPEWRQEARVRQEEAQRGRAQLIPAPAGGELQGSETRLERAMAGDIAATKKDAARLQHLEALGVALEREHGEAWLKDLLAVPSGAREWHWLDLLTQMARIRGNSRFDLYDSLADRIATFTGAALPAPLAAWRDFELLYRASHSRNLAACPDSDGLLRRLEARHYRWFQVSATLERSTCENGRNRVDSAYEFAQAGVRLAGEFGYESVGLRGKGFVDSNYVNQGRYREAYQLSRDTIEEIMRGPYQRRAHEFYNNMMRAADRLEHWYTARAAAAMARETAAWGGFSVYEMIAQCKRADFSLRLGMRNEADGEYAEAMRLYSHLTPTANVVAYAATAKADILESRKDYDGLRALLQTMVPDGNPFLEAPVDIALARVALERKDAARSLNYARRLTGWLGEAKSASNADRNAFRKMMERASVAETRALLALGDAAGAYRAWREHLVREARLLGGQTSLAEAPAAGEAVLTLAELDEAIGLWLRTPSDLHFAWSPAPREEALREIRRLNKLASDAASPPAEIHLVASSLWRSLFTPALGSVRGIHRLKIECRGELGSFPAMMLVAEFAPELLPAGAPFVPLPLARRDRGAGGTLVVGATVTDPDLESRLPPLAGLAAELERLRAVLPGAELLSGAKATPRAIEKAIRGARLVHFAGHAVHAGDGVALVVAPDPQDPRPEASMGLWRITPATPISADLLVLSACSTAELEETESVSPSRLAEAALLAGAHRAVGTLWDIDSRAAARFDTAFYENLARGAAAEEAFASAVLAVRGVPEFRHPYYWAPFTLFETAQQQEIKRWQSRM